MSRTVLYSNYFHAKHTDPIFQGRPSAIDPMRLPRLVKSKSNRTSISGRSDAFSVKQLDGSRMATKVCSSIAKNVELKRDELPISETQTVSTTENLYWALFVSHTKRQGRISEDETS